MVGIVEALVQVVVVGGVIFQEGAGLRQGAVQIHGAAHQEVRLGIVHLRLHAGHGVAAAQGDVLDLNAGVLFELLGNGDGVVFVQRGVDDQFAAGFGTAFLTGGGAFLTGAAAGQKGKAHECCKSHAEELFHR